LIFVTVGTHEQPFQRLLDEVERLAGSTDLEFVCQLGPANAGPTYEWTRLTSPAVMADRIASAEVVICHGGPATIIEALNCGKPVVLVPRQAKYGEHVDDHQLAFCRRLAVQWTLPLVEDISELETAIGQARTTSSSAGNPAGAGVDTARRVIADELRQALGDRSRRPRDAATTNWRLRAKTTLRGRRRARG
jgi:UDP-N-acetylglucosamine transferase subunit ALG13